MYPDPSSRDAQKRYVSKKIGPLLIIFGIGLLILYIFNFIVSIINGEFPALFFLPMFSIPMIIFGVIATAAAYRKDLPRYTTNQPNPADFVNRYMPSSAAYKNAPEDQKFGANPSSPKKIKCRACGKLSNSGTTYCSHCGEKLR